MSACSFTLGYKANGKMMLSAWAELISSAQLCKCTLPNIHPTPRSQTATAKNAFFCEPSALIFHPDSHPKPTKSLLGLQAAGLEEETLQISRTDTPEATTCKKRVQGRVPSALYHCPASSRNRNPVGPKPWGYPLSAAPHLSPPSIEPVPSSCLWLPLMLSLLSHLAGLMRRMRKRRKMEKTCPLPPTIMT